MAIEEKKDLSLSGSSFRTSIRFDRFELDVKNCELRRGGAEVDLSPQAFRVLVMLAARPEELVTRKEIKDALWPPGQQAGDLDSRLNFAVKKLREALGDDAEQPRYIRTVRNAGYRFIAPVREAESRNLGLEADTGTVRDKTSPHFPTPQAGEGGEKVRFWGQTSRTVVVSVLLAVAVNLSIFALWERSRGAHEQTLHLYTPLVDRTTGRVIIRGVDTAHPKIPFQFEWGDGTTSTGWFPQAKTYPMVSHSYKVRVVATYPDGSHTDASESVDLVFGADVGANGEPRTMPTPNKENADPSQIFSVSPILPQARQRIVIKGTGFGLHVPYAHTDSPYLSIRDLSAHWAAGRLIPQNWDEVMVDVDSWNDTEIVVSGFSGDYGQRWKLSPGDNLEFAVWNPQSGVGPALFPGKVASADVKRDTVH